MNWWVVFVSLWVSFTGWSVEFRDVTTADEGRHFFFLFLSFLRSLTSPKCYWISGPVWFDTFLCARTVRLFLELWQFAPTATTKHTRCLRTYLPKMSLNLGSSSIWNLSMYSYSSSVPRTLAILTNCEREHGMPRVKIKMVLVLPKIFRPQNSCQTTAATRTETTSGNQSTRPRGSSNRLESRGVLQKTKCEKVK